jgi:leucine dehydrogenase
METRYVTGISREFGGSGDPSGLTALGTFHGIRAAAQYRLGRTHCDGLRIAVQGYGAVGRHLCRMLKDDGAQLYVQDSNSKRALEAAKECGATVVTESELFDLDVDVYAPCARGATLNSDTLPRLKAKIIAGCANNQLEDEHRHSAIIKERKILYAPDYVINAGGLINVANELGSHNEERVKRDVVHIAETLLTIFADADRLGISTQDAANHYAEDRINKIHGLKHLNTYKTSVYAKLKQA